VILSDGNNDKVIVDDDDDLDFFKWETLGPPSGNPERDLLTYLDVGGLLAEQDTDHIDLRGNGALILQVFGEVEGDAWQVFNGGALAVYTSEAAFLAHTASLIIDIAPGSYGNATFGINDFADVIFDLGTKVYDGNGGSIFG
jgi:hypothetical protein